MVHEARLTGRRSHAAAERGPMGALPASLEATWKERHRLAATAAFAKAKAEGQAVGAPSFFAATAEAAE